MEWHTEEYEDELCRKAPIAMESMKDARTSTAHLSLATTDEQDHIDNDDVMVACE